MICSGEKDEGGNGDGPRDEGERFRSSGRHDGLGICMKIFEEVVDQAAWISRRLHQARQIGTSFQGFNAASREITSRPEIGSENFPDKHGALFIASYFKTAARDRIR
jgi:hypothetical protein